MGEAAAFGDAGLRSSQGDEGRGLAGCREKGTSLTPGGSLPCCFVEEHAGGDGGVEAFDGAGRGDGDAGLSVVEELRRETGSFVADQQGAGAGEAGAGAGYGVRVGRGWNRGKDGNFALGQRGKSERRFLVNHRQAKGGASGGAEGLRVPEADGAGESEDTGCAESFGGTNDCAQVPGILECGGDDDQRSGAGKGFDEREAGRLDEGGETLGGFGIDRAVEDGGGELDDGDGGGQAQAAEEAEAGVGAVGIAADEDTAQADAAAQGFGEEVLALDADGFGGVAAGASEGGAQLADAGVLATLYNADEARAIRNRRHGAILIPDHSGAIPARSGAEPAILCGRPARAQALRETRAVLRKEPFLAAIGQDWVQPRSRGAYLLLDGRGLGSGDSAHPSGRA